MNERELGRTGIKVTPVGLGCWQFSGGQGLTGSFWAPIDRAVEREIIRTSLDGGVTWFDTAEIYGNGTSEKALADGLKAAGKRPGEVVIATKWFPLLRRARHLRASVGDRIEALGGFGIDLHQVHMRGSFSTIPAQMNAMADLVESHKIRAIGVSNFSARAMRAAHEALRRRGLTLASNQVRYNLLYRRIETNGVLRAARELGVTIIAYSPLAQGLLGGAYHADPDLIQRKGGVRRRMRAFRPASLRRTAPLVEALADVAKAHEATPAQVALSWVTRFHGDVIVVIPGATSAEQARLNAESMRIELTAKEMDAIDRASRTRLA